MHKQDNQGLLDEYKEEWSDKSSSKGVLLWITGEGILFIRWPA